MASDNSTPGPTSPQQGRGRFWNRRIRRASFISPITGERSKRNFTLRDASLRPNGDASESTPLLNGYGSGNDHGLDASTGSLVESYWEYGHKHSSKAWTFATSKTGIGILKCSLAYLLGSLATLVPAISGLIGHRQDSKHMVATVTVWFHPARSIGSMHEATVLALIALVYSGAVSFTSMGISVFFGQNDLLIVGHTIVLICFLAGGLGLVAWVKQYFGDPLVNVACSLASLGCITILIKEGAVQAGEFSDDRVLQVLAMVCMGIIATTAVNVLILPITARGQLVADLEKNTDLLSEMLVSITRAFLSGREGDLQDDFYKTLSADHQTSLSSMNKNLKEAKRELLLLGKEEQYNCEARIVECLAGLAQDLGGLRSAALAQFAFMNENEASKQSVDTLSPNRERLPSSFLGVINESPEDSDSGDILYANGHGSDTTSKAAVVHKHETGSSSTIAEAPSDFFLAFLDELAPPTRSLVYTLKQILDKLPFRPREPDQSWFWKRWQGIDVEVAVNENFHSSLKRALDLYKQSRKEALSKVYATRAISASSNTQTTGKVSGSGGRRSSLDGNGTLRNRASGQHGTARSARPIHSEEVLADIEEVSACCGHFSFSLLDFAEDVLTYLSALDDLKTEMQAPKRSWRWMLLWRDAEAGSVSHEQRMKNRGFHEEDEAADVAHTIPSYIRRADDFADPEKSSRQRPWTYKIHRSLHGFRRDDVRFAIKVGLGALLYALPAFVSQTRPFFVRWRGEWGLVSYMAVCSMTVGASNTTSINRFIGTIIGACLAIAAWLLASDHGDANPWILGFFGWVVSLGCFYLIIAKNNGPMGRFILLTFNLGALYSYSLSIKDDDNDDDEGGIDPAIWDIVLHRLVAVIVGCLWAIVVTRLIWPISARRKLKDGLCILWLRMGLVWKRDPLAMFLLGEPRSSYMDIREESSLQSFLANLQGLRKGANSEYELRGPFPDAIVGRILERTSRMLDAFHAMNVVISKNLQYTPGEAAVLRHTRPERFALSARISHLFTVLASSMKLEYPLNDVLPSIDNSRDRLLAKISEFRQEGDGKEKATEQDYELLYAYVLVTGQLAQDIQAVSAEIETLYGTLNEDNLKLH